MRPDLRRAEKPQCNPQRKTVKKYVKALVSGSHEQKTHSGQWTQTWKVAGSRNFSSSNTSVATVLQIDRRFRARFESGGSTYIAEGAVDVQTIIGVWRDAAAGGVYHGAFELSVLRNGRQLAG
jgi:hypothetical protein